MSDKTPLTEVSRYAPSTTGPAHPGTLLAALLCWLDARSTGAQLELRLEDLDPDRCKPEYARDMTRDLAWLGLDWDCVREQHDGTARYEAALDRLAADGRLYPCACTRSQIRAAGMRTPDGGYRYPGTCRARSLPEPGGWRACDEPIRVRLPEGVVHLVDEGGLDLSQDPVATFGDPVVRRRDGAFAYHLAGVVDDEASAITRIVRGRDLATTTATQIALRTLLGFAVPSYRHHLLLLEPRGDKLAKLHGAVSAAELKPHYDAAALCGLLAHAAGLRDRPEPTTPSELLADFTWDRVATEDRVTLWDGQSLRFVPQSQFAAE